MRRILGVVVMAGVMLFGSFSPVAGAVQAKGTTLRTAEIDRTISAVVKAKFRQAGYPARWKTSVLCHRPRTIKVGTTFKCTVFELPTSRRQTLNEGSLQATISSVEPTS